MKKLALTQEQVEHLFKKGHINEDTYAKLCKGGLVKGYAEGGQVTLPPADQVYNQAAQGAQSLTANVPDWRISNLIPDSQKKFFGDVGKGLSTLLPQSSPNPNPELAAAAPQEQQVPQAPGQTIKQASGEIGPHSGYQEPLASDQVKQDNNPMAQMMKMQSGYLQNQLGIMDRMGKAQQEGALEGMKAANAQAAYINEGINERNKLAHTMQQDEIQRQDYMKDAEAKVAALNEKYNSPEMALTPGKVFKNQSTGQKVAMFIGLALMGKSAPDMLKSIIQNDLDFQKANLDKLGKQISTQQGLLSDVRARFSDKRQADIATQAIMLDNVRARIDQMAMKYKGVEIQKNAEIAKAQIDLQKQQLMQQGMQAVMANMPLFTAGEQMRNILLKVPKEMHDNAVKELGEYQKHEKVKDTAQEAMDTMFKNRNSAGLSGTSIGVNGYSDYQAAKSTLKTLTSELFGGKSEQEFKIIEGLLPKPGDTPKTLAYKKEKLGQKLDSQTSFPLLDSYGIRPRPLSLTPNRGAKD